MEFTENEKGLLITALYIAHAQFERDRLAMEKDGFLGVMEQFKKQVAETAALINKIEGD